MLHLRGRLRRAASHLLPRSVRARTTLAATAVVAVTLALACAALVVLQDRQLVGGLSDLADQQSSEVATQLQGGTAPGAVNLAARSGSRGDHALLQVNASDGAVLATTDDGDDGVALIGEGTSSYGVDRSMVDSEPFVVVHRDVTLPDGSVVTVVAAQSLETVEKATAVAISLMGFGYPLVLLVVAGTSWWLTGRALRPVEGIRARVDEIATTGAGARVPVPASHDEIARLAATMNAMLARLQVAADAQRRFTADASHELRSPLASLRAITELSRDHPAAVPWAEATDTVLAEADRLDALVGDLLLLARTDEQAPQWRRDDVDLDDVVGAEVARVHRLGPHRVVGDITAVRVRGDAGQLSRAVRNLVDNADHHAATSIDLRLTTDGGLARIEVSDDGPGIPLEDRERVFERFVRLDSSRDRTSGGTGLGLAITRQIAREHGGDVIAYPRSGGGTTMVLTVVADESAASPDDEQHDDLATTMAPRAHVRALSPRRR